MLLPGPESRVYHIASQCGNTKLHLQPLHSVHNFLITRNPSKSQLTNQWTDRTYTLWLPECSFSLFCLWPSFFSSSFQRWTLKNLSSNPENLRTPSFPVFSHVKSVPLRATPLRPSWRLLYPHLPLQ